MSDRARERLARIAKLCCDSGFERTVIEHCRNHHIGVELVKSINAGLRAFPKRWIEERTWAWLMNRGRHQVDYERDSGSSPRASTGRPRAAICCGD